ncbi:unnamed protein product [Ectocarpus sp. 12 AP-2014]
MLQRHRNSKANSNRNHGKDVSTAAAAAAAAGRRTRKIATVGRRKLWIVVTSFIGCCFCMWLLFSLYVASSSEQSEARRAVRSGNVRDFQGITRTNGNDTDSGKPRIAIISNAVAFPFGSATTAHWSLFKEYFANKDCYANTHGYDLIIDSRNHVNGMGFYTDENGHKGGTNVHFNKPYLIRKWLPHYDWVLWLDMDALVVDLVKPIEKFIEEVGGQDGDIHVLVPQDQNVQFFFSACSLLLRNSPETMEMVEDWFALKDTCPYAMYDDQSRLYAAILRMQLRCFDSAVRAMGINRVPKLYPPVAYSRLPTRMFTKGTDFEGQFGGIKTHPHLVEHAFSVHTKPFCQKSFQICSPFVDAILAPNYQKGMQRCYGQGWVAKPYMALATLHEGAKSGPAADNEALGVHVKNASSVEALVPGLNVPYGIQFTGMRESQHAKGGRGGGGSGGGPGWRQMGTKEDKRFCFASLPGAGGREFMGQVLGPLLLQRFCTLGSCDGISLIKAKRRAHREQTPCKIAKVYQVFPYNLMSDYAENSRQPFWHMSMIRDPVDRVS